MIRAASLRGFAPVVRALGGSPEELLDRFGISADALASDDALISITAHDLMLDAAAAELTCADLGLRLAEAQDLSILGPLALAIEASSTAADAMDCASRYLFVHSPALRIDVAADPYDRKGVIALRYRKDLVESPYSAQAMELGVGLFRRVAGALLGSGAGLRSVLFPHQPQSPIRRYTEFFDAHVRFGAPFAALCVERRVLDHVFAGKNELIRQVAVDHLARRYPDPATLTSVRVRRALAEGLGFAPPSLSRTARLLETHPRTLQRRLAKEGTTFERVLDDVRREAAHRYVTGTTLPLADVATLVGFGEQSTLTHAVRRWYGISPRDMRGRTLPQVSH